MTNVNQLLEEAAKLYAQFEKNKDDERLAKVKLVAEKLRNNQFTIGFAGHFSAGKSSMINALTNEQLLPTSPIPTSANIVNVQKADEDYVVLHETDGRALKYVGHDFTEAIQAFSKNGEDVARIDIGHASSQLPKGVVVMDTPGVDSTDEAHALSTESSLHLSDLVFYTMDYNHVQSELNFTFTKQLMAYNPNVYLIVNQVDKHREAELSFEAFKESVRASFATWGVHPKAIFFTSLREKDLPYNDFEQVKALVDDAIAHAGDQFEVNVANSLKQLKEEHFAYLKRQIEETKADYPELEASEWADVAAKQQAVEALANETHLLSKDQFSKTFDRERKELIDDASITPFEVRERLEQYIESKSPKFKVGLFFSAKKTEEERQARRTAFFEALAPLLHAQIELHIRQLMKKKLRDVQQLTDERLKEIDEYPLTIPNEAIDEVIVPTDVVSGDLVLNYTTAIRSKIERLYKEATDEWVQRTAKIVAASGTGKLAELQQSLKEQQAELIAVQEVAFYEQAIQNFDQQLERQDLAVQNTIDRLLTLWQQPLDYVLVEDYEQVIVEEEAPMISEAQEQTVETVHVEDTLKQAQFVVDQMKTLNGLEDWAHYLQMKTDRLRQQQFTVALFGAFSAGKSSFSNALIGNRALPVSPNPTTAAINKIVPATAEKAHHFADVHLKSEAIMLEDMQNSYEQLGLTVSSLQEAFERADEALRLKVTDERNHLHQSFIRAYQLGYNDYVAHLGETLYVDEQEFTQFVALEQRSCFVDSIDYYFDSPLTRQGITLVDTPGADSINARHTDVAFEYIRNADAILFVTYYNHAFARADREFLIQLGRVKDAFEMDKMFFIVNAIDLAQNEEEKQQVKDYVARELTKLGIRHPRVYGVSSLEALEAKLRGEMTSEMTEIEADFYSFLANDLKGMAALALHQETTAAVTHIAEQVECAKANLARKDERLQELASIEQNVQPLLNDQPLYTIFKLSIEREIEELVYYVNERIQLRFNDFLKEAYNPSLFAKYGKKEALEKGLAQLLQFVRFDYTQELKVTNLRIGQYLQKIVKERQQTVQKEAQAIDPALYIPTYDVQEPELLTFEEGLQDETALKGAHHLVKNEKHFFVQKGREQFGEALQQLMNEQAKPYLTAEVERMTIWAKEYMLNESERFYQHLEAETTRILAAEHRLLENVGEIEQWEHVQQILEQQEVTQ